MSSQGNNKDNKSKRRFLIGATSLVGAGFTGMVAWPFLASFSPSARAKAVGAPVEFDLSKLAVGQLAIVTWRGQPVWILHRGSEALENLKTMDAVVLDAESKGSEQPEYANNNLRSVAGKDEYFVVVSTCTHLGCIPEYRQEVGSVDADWKGGFFCQCHGSKFDLAGRVYPGMPAPRNLAIPPYSYVDGKKIVIGVDPEEAKGVA